MKVLQIVNYMYPSIGGIEKVARDVANILSAEPQMEQKIICFNSDAKCDGVQTLHNETKKDCVDGVEVIRCGCIGKICSQSLSLPYCFELKKLMDDFVPDVVIFHYPNPFATFFLSDYFKRNFRLIVFWHNDIIKQRLLKNLFIGQTQKLLQRADAIIAASPNYVDGSSWLQKFKSKVVVIPDAIRELPQNISVTNKDENQGNKIKVFALGRHVKYKGLEYLIKASRLLDDRFEIFIGGNGPLTDKLKKMAENDHKVKFLGQLTDAEVAMYYAKCDIFCFPSITKNEGFGIALAQALAYGKPCVTFTIPGSGVNYINIDGETGLECPNGDVVAYAKAMETLADDENLRKRYGENAKKRAKIFSLNKFKTSFVEMLNCVATKS